MAKKKTKKKTTKKKSTAKKATTKNSNSKPSKKAKTADKKSKAKKKTTEKTDKNLARKATASLKFNGKKVSVINEYLESVSYTDVASGGSDSMTIRMHNIDAKWVNGWYPKKGSTVSGSLKFANWNNDGEAPTVSCGTLTLDDIKINFSPKTAEFSCVSEPASESFRVREQKKTWEKVTIKKVAQQICSRYKMKLSYSGPEIKINEMEQSGDDCSFLSGLCETYGLGMKIYKNKIVIYDQSALEEKKSIKTLALASFVDQELSITDGIYGTYTGAKVTYKPAKAKKNISVYVGLKKENAKGSRIIRINESCASEGDARRKGAAKVNLSNMKETVLSGSLFPDPKIVAGVCVYLGKEFGKLKGKYFVDKVTWELGGSGTSQRIEAHKVQKKVKV